jgi:hypothetical protein
VQVQHIIEKEVTWKEFKRYFENKYLTKRYYDRKYKARTVHTVQQAKTVEDMGIRMPRIYAALDNK